MKIKKRYIIHPFNVVQLLFFKPIIDVFYQVQVLDYCALVMAIIVLVLELQNRKLEICQYDIIIIGIFALYTFTLLRSWSGSNFIIYIKTISAIILYFIARLSSEEVDICISSVTNGYICALIINLVAIVGGVGIKQWGAARTLTGLYYFKTDMAIALIMLLLFLLSKTKLSFKIVAMSVGVLIMLVLTNARISYLVAFLIVFFAYIYHKEVLGKCKRLLKINMKLIALVMLLGFAMLFMLRFLGNTAFFAKQGFISLNFLKVSDLFSDANTQGRTAIWTNLLNDFKNHGFLQHMFGINLNTALSFRVGTRNITHNAHNLYLALLYETGYVGIFLWILQLIGLISKLNDLRNRKLFFVTLMITTTYCLFGISVNVHEFTAYSWMFMYFTGLSFNKQMDKEIG